ncbi:MAG: branched-chain amino acid ABC transporter permease [Alcaligenaceae bacterium]|nr:branched-chain amino acid ABC transporter permease [Alcaligenaceae bacterium]
MAEASAAVSVMTAARRGFEPAWMIAILVVGLLAPWILPDYLADLALLWLMVLLALTWDINGGQMGYNSFGNIFFFGLGVYACAVFQREADLGYLTELLLGMGLGGLVAMAAAAVLGPALLGMRGHYFSIATLGIAFAAADVFSGWEYVGAASGLSTPLYPGDIQTRSRFFYFILFALAVLTFLVLRWLYSRRFGLIINAIRDDEDKAEAMGIRTTRYKVLAWCVAALFLGLAGGPVANLIGFIDPRDLAFAGDTYGVWMIFMAILGGRGTLWGPVVGAVIFHVTQQVFWIYLLGWQRVAMGLMIVLIVVFFPRGILGRWTGRKGTRLEGGTQ